MAYKYNAQRVSEVLREGINSLDDLCEVEDFIAKVKDIDKTIAFYKDQKKSRVKIIDNAMSELASQKEQIKKVIKNTLDGHNEESLSFPDVGIVKKRAGSSKWIISNDDLLIEKFREHLTEEEFKSVVEMKPKISKSSADKLFKKWKAGGSWPEGAQELAYLNEDLDSVSFKLEKSFNPSPDEIDEDEFFKESHKPDKSKSLDDVFGEVSGEDI